MKIKPNKIKSKLKPPKSSLKDSLKIDIKYQSDNGGRDDERYSLRDGYRGDAGDTNDSYQSNDEGYRMTSEGDRGEGARGMGSQGPKKKKKSSKRGVSSFRGGSLTEKVLSAWEDKYSRRYIILGIVICVLLFSAYWVVRVRDINMGGIKKSLNANAITTDMNRGDDSTLRKLYGIESYDTDGYVLYSPKTNMEANEILILKSKPGKVDEEYAKVKKRVDEQSKSFQNYSPDQYKIISNNVLKKQGDYIILIITKNNEVVEGIISNNYK